MATPGSPAMSATSTASTTVMETTPNSRSLVNLWKQGKYIVVGAVLTWYFQVVSHLSDSLSFGVRTTMEAKLGAVSVAFLAATVGLFGYVILLPARGHNPRYADWTNDPHLARAIPALTACIVIGWTTLLITLSPIGAPSPPSLSLSTRIQQAAAYVGLHPAANTFMENTKAITLDSVVKRLSLSPSQSTVFKNYFAQISSRAEAWAVLNIRTIGWTGALAGSVGAYLLVFGSVGLLGCLAPDNRPSKQKHF